MIMAQQQKEQSEINAQKQQESRSPSVDSVSRLHQQSGGFASHNQQPNHHNSQQHQQHNHQRRGSFSKEGGGGGYYPQYQNNGGYNNRRQSFNQRGNRSNNQRNGGGYQGEYSGNNYHQGGYHHQQKQQRNYQNSSHHNSKYSHYFQQQHGPKPIFNSTQEMGGAYSVRRTSPPTSSPSPTPMSSMGGGPSSQQQQQQNRCPPVPAPILLRHVETAATGGSEKSNNNGRMEEQQQQQEHHDAAKIHQYRSAGTAPGAYSNCSSPYKQPPPPQPPSTPSSTPSSSEKQRGGDSGAEDWSRFPHAPPPGLSLNQNQFRRQNNDNNVPAPIELQRKNPSPPVVNASVPIEIPGSQQGPPTTPSSFERTLGPFRGGDQPVVETVDGKHPCFSDERMHSALYGVSPQVKNPSHPPGIPIQNEREASMMMDALKTLQYQHWPQAAVAAAAAASMPRNHLYQLQFPPYVVDQMRAMKSREQQMYQQQQQQNVGIQKEVRDSSNDSRCSSSEVQSIPQLMDQLDDEVTGATDLDKTPINGNEKEKQQQSNSGGKGSRKGSMTKRGERKEQAKELPRRTTATRRDSNCSTLSSASGARACPSPTLDESTLTKILPTDDFRPGRGVSSPSPPAELVSEPLSRMDVLSEKIWDYHNQVSQTDEMLQRKLHLRDMLYTAISPVFPLSGLYVVGSSLNGFGNNSSDMDLCLMITNKDLDQKNDAVVVLNLILSTLQYEKFVASQKLILAKVPILRIKFAAPFDDITVDLNANNSVAIRNTHLLCYYSSYDWRVRPLVSVVKEWAKRKGINDANKSSFTSYSLVLMVIHYLQCGTQAKVLPNLQQTYPSRFSNKVDVRTLNVTTALEQVADDIDPSLSEKTTLGELLIGFLNYYANDFNYDRDAISIRQGRRVERAALAARPKMHTNSETEKDTPPPSSSASSSSLHNGMMTNPHFWRSQWRCVCIEEPFTNSNTAHSIYDEMVFGAIKEAFREAHRELQHNHDLDRLLDCEPIKASTTNAGAAVYAATYEGERPLAQQPTSIVSANLRAISSTIPTSNGGGGGQYHYQPKQQNQQRPGSNQGFQMNGGHHHNHRGSGGGGIHGGGSQQQNQRRSYQSNGGNNGSSRSSRGGAPENKDSSTSNSTQQQMMYHRQKNGGGGAIGSSKENIAAGSATPASSSGASSGMTTTMTSPQQFSSSAGEKNGQMKDDERNRIKRTTLVVTPDAPAAPMNKSPAKSE